MKSDAEMVKEFDDIVDAAAAKLGERFDNVIIFVNSHHGEDKGTFVSTRKRGNIYALTGQVAEWLDEPISEADPESDDDAPDYDDPPTPFT